MKGQETLTIKVPITLCDLASLQLIHTHTHTYSTGVSHTLWGKELLGGGLLVLWGLLQHLLSRVAMATLSTMISNYLSHNKYLTKNDLLRAHNTINNIYKL